MKKILFTVLFSISVAAKSTSFEVNQEHSKLGFSIQYMMMTNVDGVFKKFQGYFDVEENKIKNIQILVSARSVDSSDPKRDFHLKSHEFLYAAKYPIITFKSNQIIEIKENAHFKIAGFVTLRDVTKPVVIEGVFKGRMLDPWSKENLFFEGKTQINRKDFGIVWNRELDNGGYLVGDLVNIDFKLQAQLLGDKTPFSTHMVPTTKGIIERDKFKKGKIKKLSTETGKPINGIEKKD